MKYDLRLVAVNLRDYPGSTPYTAEELAALSNPDPTIQAKAFRSQAEQLVAFLEYFIKQNNIPKLKEFGGTRSGGLVVLTWSMSNVISFSFLGEADTFPRTTRNLLGEYLRTVVLFGKEPELAIQRPAS